MAATPSVERAPAPVERAPASAEPAPAPAPAPEPSSVHDLELVGGHGGVIGEEPIGLGNTDSTLPQVHALMGRIDACGGTGGDREFELVIEDSGGTLVSSTSRVDAAVGRCITRVMNALNPEPSWRLKASLTRPSGKPHTWAHAPR